MVDQTRQSNGAARAEQNGGGFGDMLHDLPTDELKDQTRDLMSALAERAAAAASDKIGGLTGKLVGAVAHGGVGGLGGSDADGSDSESGSSGGGGSGGGPMKHLVKAGASAVKDKVMEKIGGGSKGGGKNKTKNTIIEQIEVGVPVRVAYNQWTQFQDFPKFTRRIETVEQKSDEKVTWKAGIYFSHRSWESTIVEQVPDERIVWRSQGEKGYVDGTVTFHEIAPNLTKILLVMEYHPQGLFERTGNAFRSQRRRARLELHQFDRHVMRQTILEQDEVEGWRGEIRDGEVVRSHEDALEEEQQESEDENGEDEELRSEDDQDGDAEEDYADDEDGEVDQYAEDQDDEGDEDDEYVDEDDDEAPEDEDLEDREYRDEDGEDTEADEDDEDTEDEDDELDDEYEDEDEFEDEYDDEPGDEDEEDSDRGGRSSGRRRREPALSR
jgi:uncharacterized membrane protein